MINGDAAVQAKVIVKCSSALACETSQAAVVLRHFRWDFDRLMGAYSYVTSLSIVLFDLNLHSRRVSTFHLPLPPTLDFRESVQSRECAI